LLLTISVILGRTQSEARRTTPESLFMKNGFVYIMANSRPTLYTGVTNNLKLRTWQHQQGTFDSFTTNYKLNKFVYYEALLTIEAAIIREKQIKDMNRKEKLEMIKKFNPKFEDLYPKIIR